MMRKKSEARRETRKIVRGRCEYVGEGGGRSEGERTKHLKQGSLCIHSPQGLCCEGERPAAKDLNLACRFSLSALIAQESSMLTSLRRQSRQPTTQATPREHQRNEPEFLHSSK